MDFPLIARELVRAARGDRSQTALNRRLGYTFNQVHRWERGQTRAKWSDFVDLAAACRIDLRSALVEVLGFYEDPARADLLVENLIRPASSAYLQRVAGVSRTEVAHWVAGRAMPRLDQVLLLLEVSRTAVVELVGRLVDLAKVESLKEAAAARATRRELLVRHPNLEVVLAALDLEGYRALRQHDDRFVSRRSGIPVAEVRTILAALVGIGTLALRRKKYVALERWALTYDIRCDFAVTRAVKLHWMKTAARTLESQTAFAPSDFFSYYLFPASDEVARKVRTEYADFIKRVVTLVTESEGKGESHVRVLGIQLFDPAGGASH